MATQDLRKNSMRATTLPPIHARGNKLQRKSILELAEIESSKDPEVTHPPTIHERSSTPRERNLSQLNRYEDMKMPVVRDQDEDGYE